MVFPSWLRTCAAMTVMVGLLGLGAGCKRSTANSDTATVSGTVSYTRLPVLRDSDGRPTGALGAGTVQLARGVVVRVFQLYQDLLPDGKLHQNWRPVGSAVTDANGGYAVGGAAKGRGTFVEVDAVFQQVGNHGAAVQIIADPDGIASALPEPLRPIYAMRKDLGGTLVPNPVAPVDTDPLDPNLPLLSGDTTVNFNVGASDAWVATLPTWNQPGSNPDPAHPGTQAPPSASNLLLGSRVLAILDSIYTFTYTFGDPTPSKVNGGVLDLHYYPGLPAAGPRAFVIYDPAQAPRAYDGKKARTFATLSGGPSPASPGTLDDAMDPGVIYPMLARNFLFGQGKTALFPTGRSELASLSPDLALVDGLADAMAATLIQSPWLTDATSTAALPPRDIRVLPAQPGFASPATVAAAAWRLTLDAYNIAPPGTAADWARIDPTVLARIYNLINPFITIPAKGGEAALQSDIPNMFAQVGRLQEPRQSGMPDLPNIFSNLELLVVLEPFGVIWPQPPQLAPSFSADWGLDPDSLLAALPPFTLSMTGAVQIPDLTIGAAAGAKVFPNCSQGEVAYAKLKLTYARDYSVSVAVPALPATAVIEVTVDGRSDQTFRFSAADLTAKRVSLSGNPSDAGNPARHFVRTRVLSPAVQQPDLQVTVSLDRTN